MNVSYEWLRSIVPDLSDTPQQLADRLASYGAAVDEVIDVGEALGDIVIARVVEAGRHPNADRLSVCLVDAGGADPLRVVCGAPNVRAGAFYPFIPAGGTLPGGMKIRRTKIRGEESNGMLCSARELGLGRDHEGILELHGTFETGTSFLDAVGLRDTRLVIDVTPNRPDLLSHFGVAREIAGGGVASLRLPAFPSANGAGDTLRFEAGAPEASAAGVSIRLDDTDACARYYGVVIRGVEVKPSPEWLASRLRAVGARPINNVVDATNWILHELGQPMHAFDLDRLGPQVVVRRALEGETLVTLDGVTRRLNPEMLVIADAERPVALAGVMGGEATEVTADTTNVLLECALFDPRTTRETRRRGGLSTDASQRYERGVDPDMMERAVRRAVQLIVAVAGGSPADAAPLADAGVPATEPIHLRTARVRQVLGIDLDAQAIADLLRPIGFAVDDVRDEALTVRVPGHRRYDVSREIDLVEEVARRHGFDRFPDELRPFRPGTVPDDAFAHLEHRLREMLVGHGLLESRTVAFAPEAAGSVELLLPLSAAESRLRSDLATGLVRRAEANFNRGARAVRLFEIGTVFSPAGESGLPGEQTRLAVLLTGPREPLHWSGESAPVDLWDLRGLAERLAERLRVELRPGFDARLWVASESWHFAAGDEVLGGAGLVRPAAIDAPPWADPVYALEITLTHAMTTAEPVAVRTLPAHPAIERDLALLLPAGVAAADVIAGVRGAAGPLLEDVTVFDVYADEKLGEGRRSVAFRLRFRAPDRTLVDADVDDAVASVLKRLEEEHRVERRA